MTGKSRITGHKELEPAYVDEVRVLGTTGSGASAGAPAGAPPRPVKASVKLRFNRNPVCMCVQRSGAARGVAVSEPPPRVWEGSGWSRNSKRPSRAHLIATFCLAAYTWP